jgi:hypothetical protein
MAKSRKTPAGERTGRGKTEIASRKKATKPTVKKPVARRGKTATPAPRKKGLPKVDKLVGLDLQPKIVLDQTPPAIVGPSLPFDIDHPSLKGLDPAVVEAWREENIQVHEYPDRDSIDVDEDGYVVGLTMAPADRSYAVREQTHVIMPDKLVHGLMQDHLPNLLKSGNVPSPTVLKLLSGMKSTKQDGTRYKVPSELLHGLLNLNLPDPQAAKGGRSGGGGGGNKVPSPQLAEQVYKQLLAGVPKAGYNDNLAVIIQNGEFLNASKASFYLEVWKMIQETAHIGMWIECDLAALTVIGKALGYGYFACKANSRGQGVGFLVHPRLKLLSAPETIWEIAWVANRSIADLRPGYRLHVKDTVSGEEFYIMVMHPKSMRGGMNQTSPIRVEQFDEAVKANQGLSPIILAGDLNCILPNTSDIQPLIKANYKLVLPTDTTATQSMGSRLDGALTLLLKLLIGHYQVFNGWKNKQIGRGVTDHAMVRFILFGTGGPATDPDTNYSVEVVVP